MEEEHMGSGTQLLYYLEEYNEVSILIRLVLAALMGSIIGIERGSNKQVAGMRTFALVCVGSALAQIVDIQCIMTYGTGDPVRLAQGVISGIGFLGVGTIVVLLQGGGVDGSYFFSGGICHPGISFVASH